jgi:hypothetical protein
LTLELCHHQFPGKNGYIRKSIPYTSYFTEVILSVTAVFVTSLISLIAFVLEIQMHYGLLSAKKKCFTLTTQVPQLKYEWKTDLETVSRRMV